MNKNLLKFSFLFLSVVFMSGISMAQNLYVNGSVVNENNADDLSVIEGVQGTIYFNIETNTLTLKNVDIYSEEYTSIYYDNSEKLLTVNLSGENHLSCIETEPNCNALITSSDNGILTLGGADKPTLIGIYIKSKLTIKDCSVAVDALNWGITGLWGTQGEILEVNNSTVKVNASYNGCVADLEELILINSGITAPENAVFDDTLHDIVIDGEMVVNQEVIISPLNNIKNIENTADIQIYPNPTKDIINIKTKEENFNVKIYDLTGKLILEKINNTNIVISNLEKGIYLFELTTEQGTTFSQKIIKE